MGTTTRQRVAASILPVVVCLVGFASAPAQADGFCRTQMTGRSFLASDASKDLYNAALWLGGTAAVNFGTKPTSRWSRSNSFDRSFRNSFAGSAVSTRKAAVSASDVLLGFSAGLLPMAAVGWTLFEGDCEEAYDMTTDALESVALTLFVTESVKAIAGRERPFVESCDGTPPRDANCGKRDRFAGFFSGHASVAAAGAGVSCAFAIRRRTFGESATARAVPCMLGATAAIASGTLRIVSDKHWGTDVLVGLGIGATIGYFDTWGPFDLLDFEMESNDHSWQVQGVVLPYAGDGTIGAQLAITF